MRIRTIDAGDWDAIVALEAAAYTRLGLSETRHALESRSHATPDLCYVLDTGAELAGYLLALPHPAFHCPDLATPTIDVRRSPNLHLHDLVVAERFRRRGLATVLLSRLTSAAIGEGYQRISLVAVGGSAAFWSARGYHPCPDVALPAGYGTTARYMSRPIDDRTMSHA